MNRARGQRVEQRACRFLQARGWQLLARNFQTRRGELDLVMLDGTTLVFVEVRQRLATAYGGAAASITYNKQQRLIYAATSWLQQHPRYANHSCRFDVISCDGDPEHGPLICISHAFEAG